MELGVVDITAIGIIAFFLVLGLFKGFAFQVVRLATFVVALAVAKKYAGNIDENTHECSGLTHYLVNWFPNQFNDDTQKIAVYISFFLIFIGILILGTLLAFLLRKVIVKLELRAHDKILGGLLGIVVGSIFIVVLVSGISFFSPDSEFVQNKFRGSYTIRFSTKVIDISKPFFPLALRERMNEIIDKIPHTQPIDNESKTSVQ